MILFYNCDKRMVILMCQFCFLVFINGYEDDFIEVVVGLLDNMDFESCIKVEVEEEIGYCVFCVEKVFEVYMSSGFVMEKFYFYIVEYYLQDWVSVGGGIKLEGEDIDVLEMLLDEVL